VSGVSLDRVLIGDSYRPLGRKIPSRASALRVKSLLMLDAVADFLRSVNIPNSRVIDTLSSRPETPSLAWAAQNRASSEESVGH
jgi:hypothetical protein